MEFWTSIWQQSLQVLQQKFENHLNLFFDRCPFDPLLKDENWDCLVLPMKQLCQRPGKRFRPLLSLFLYVNLCYSRQYPLSKQTQDHQKKLPLIWEDLIEQIPDFLWKLAVSTELLHNASLMIDDIEDQSDQRRGQPAIHKIYGIDTTINSANFFYFQLLSVILHYSDTPLSTENANLASMDSVYKMGESYALTKKLTNHYTNLMNWLHQGQGLDIQWHKLETIPSFKKYFYMVKGKTAALIQWCAHLAFIFNQLDYPLPMQQYIDQWALFFQVKDDWSNWQSNHLGKGIGDDLWEKKKSFPVISLFMMDPKNTFFQDFYQAITSKDQQWEKASTQIQPALKQTQTWLEINEKQLQQRLILEKNHGNPSFYTCWLALDYFFGQIHHWQKNY